MELLPSSYASLPSEPGVYCFLNESGAILYVGKAKDLKARVSSYFQPGAVLGTKTSVLVHQTKKVKIVRVETEVESLLLEAFYIKKYSPKYNVRLTDNKSYPLIRITVKDAFPKILLARRVDDPTSAYFGPYPNAGAVKLVLRIMRRIFPFQSVFNHPKRVCLYNHLGLCPCPPVHNTIADKKEYKKNIRRIIKVLEGNVRLILNELEKERNAASVSEDFESAQKVQKQMNAMSVITQRVTRPVEYEANPNLREDQRQKELYALQNLLRQKGVPVQFPQKIECYDISNIQGKYATGSLVVFIQGEKESAFYRRFRIRRENAPNDFAMMHEVLTRRLKHDEWKFPQLIVVDGGKGQITSALQAIGEAGISIPLIGLAKREETIIIPNPKFETRNSKQYQNTNDRNTKRFKHSKIQNLDLFRASKLDIRNFVEVSLPKNSPALLLLMRIRDEAHRFAITYHRNIRSKGSIFENK
ncbi:MAG: excinuclease ABC subunit UvrC [Candidatus Levybacteria bacterium]|nr:excinuclease ABC subunit UvrC [Candidatus Levybacteria bacterium]